MKKKIFLTLQNRSCILMDMHYTLLLWLQFSSKENLGIGINEASKGSCMIFEWQLHVAWCTYSSIDSEKHPTLQLLETWCHVGTSGFVVEFHSWWIWDGGCWEFNWCITWHITQKADRGNNSNETEKNCHFFKSILNSQELICNLCDVHQGNA